MWYILYNGFWYPSHSFGRRLKYGAIAGAIATWSISSILALIEAGMGLPIGSFYSIIGIALGMDNVLSASYFGFGLHILTGTIMGGSSALQSYGWFHEVYLEEFWLEWWPVF